MAQLRRPRGPITWEILASILEGLIARRRAGQCCAVHCHKEQISIQISPFDPPQRIPTWDAFDMLQSGMSIAEYFSHRIKRGQQSRKRLKPKLKHLHKK